MRTAVLAACLALALGAAAGCSLSSKLTIKDVEGACLIQGSNRCGFFAQHNICDEFGAVLKAEHPDAKSCRAACQEVQTRHLMTLTGQSCTDVLGEISGMCMEYCDGQYSN